MEHIGNMAHSFPSSCALNGRLMGLSQNWHGPELTDTCCSRTVTWQWAPSSKLRSQLCFKGQKVLKISLKILTVSIWLITSHGIVQDIIIKKGDLNSRQTQTNRPQLPTSLCTQDTNFRHLTQMLSASMSYVQNIGSKEVVPFLNYVL